MKREWLFVGKYNSPVVNELEFTHELIKILNHFSRKYENLLTIGNLNMSTENVHLNTLCNCSIYKLLRESSQKVKKVIFQQYKC